MTLSSKTLLYVEDVVPTRNALQEYFELCDYKVYVASDIATAKELLKQVEPKTALIDIVLPLTADSEAIHEKSEGVALALYCKRINFNMGVVLFSAYEDRGEEIQRLLQYSGVAYVLKSSHPPARLLEVVQLVERGGTYIDPSTRTQRGFIQNLMEGIGAVYRPVVEEAALRIAELTGAQRDIARLVTEGHDIKQIVQITHTSDNNISGHINHIYKTVGLTREDVPQGKRMLFLAHAMMIYNYRSKTK